MDVNTEQAVSSSLSALVGIIAIWMIIELFSQGFRLFGVQDPMKGMLDGECVYQVAVGGTTIGTRSFANATDLRKILDGFDGLAPKIANPEIIVSCDSIVNVDRATGQTTFSRISGTQLIAVGKKVSLNRSSREDLEAIPGIGPKMASKIVERRESTGQFNSLDELRNVSGIGPKKLNELIQFLKL